MNEQKNNGRGIFYGVIGVATLVVAIIGATFAYFTATQANNSITGNMATIKLNLAVDKVTNAEEASGGLIPMSNGMVERAVNVADLTEKEICKDDNGNGVCQVYKITLTNASSAGQFVDGYVALRDKYTIPATDIVGLMEPSEEGGAADTQYQYKTSTQSPDADYPKPVLMRWAQVFCDEAVTSCTTAGTQTLGADTNPTFTAIGEAANDASANGYNQANIRYLFKDSTADAKGVLGQATISGNTYDVINKNYIRLSDHIWKEGVQSYDRASDVTSALVFNHNIVANGKATYYIVVWLSETGTNQTAGAALSDTITNPTADSFFMGNVTFVSAQGSEVSATFSGYTKVRSDKATTTPTTPTP